LAFCPLAALRLSLVRLRTCVRALPRFVVCLASEQKSGAKAGN